MISNTNESRRSQLVLVGLMSVLSLASFACSSTDTSEARDESRVDIGAPDESTSSADEQNSGGLPIGDLEPGRYTFSELGTAATVTTQGPWFVPVSLESIVIFEDPDGPGFASDSQALLLARPTGFLSDGDIRGGYADVTGPTNDIDAWIEAVDFEVESRESAEVAGRATEVITGTVRFGDDTFLRTNAPVSFNGTPDGDYLYVRSDLRYRIWLVDQGDLDPIVAIAIAEPDDGEEWFDKSQVLMDSLELGDPAPHPRPPVVSPAACLEGGADLVGDVTFDALIDVRFTTEVPIDGGGGFESPRIEILEAGSGTIGLTILGPIDDSPDFADAESARNHIIGDHVVSSEPVLRAFGTEATGAVIETEDGPPGGNLGNVPAGGGTSGVAAGSAFWFFDTEHGLLLVNALGVSDLDASIALVNSIVPTMELSDSRCG